MKYEIIRIDTGVALPPLKVTEQIKDTIREFVQNPVTELSNLRDRIFWQLDMAREQSPNFKREMWYLYLSPTTNSLTIRYGHSGEPQLMVREAVI